VNRTAVEAWERLEFDLEVRSGFWISLVVGPDPRPRAALRKRTEAWCALHEVAFHLHRPIPEAFPALAATLADDPTDGVHWVVIDAPTHLEGAQEEATGQLLLAMNERREAYRSRLEGGVILEGPEALVRQLRVLAPDLFSMRAAVLEAGIEPDRPEESVESQDRTASFPVLRLTGDAQRAEERVARLRRRPLEGHERALLVALDRAAGMLHFERRLSRAARVAADQHALVDTLATRDPPPPWLPYERARALYRRGSVSVKSGQWAKGSAFLVEADDILSRLMAADGLGLAYRGLLARVKRWRWWVAEQQGRQSEAVRQAEDTIALRREIVDTDPHDMEMERRLVVQLMNGARLHAQEGKWGQAASELREARERARARAAAAPRVVIWVELFIDTWQQSGELALARGRQGQASVDFGEALAAAEAFAALLPQDPHRQLWLLGRLQGQALMRHQLGDVGGTSVLVARINSAIAALDHSATPPFELERLKAQLGRLEARRLQDSDRQASEDRLVDALAAASPSLSEGDAPRSLLRLGAALERDVAWLRRHTSDRVGTVAALTRAAALLARSAELSPPSLSDLVGLRRLYEDLATLHLQGGARTRAVTVVKRAVAAAELAEQRFPGHSGVRPERFDTLRRAAGHLDGAGDREGARRYLEEAALIGRDLTQEGAAELVPADVLAQVHVAAAHFALSADDLPRLDAHVQAARALVASGTDDHYLMRQLEALDQRLASGKLRKT